MEPGNESATNTERRAPGTSPTNQTGNKRAAPTTRRCPNEWVARRHARTKTTKTNSTRRQGANGSDNITHDTQPTPPFGHVHLLRKNEPEMLVSSARVMTCSKRNQAIEPTSREGTRPGRRHTPRRAGPAHSIQEQDPAAYHFLAREELLGNDGGHAPEHVPPTVDDNQLGERHWTWIWSSPPPRQPHEAAEISWH